MKHTTYMPSEDDENKVRHTPGKYYMKTNQKLVHQRMRNNAVRTAEQQIDQEINEFFKTHEGLYGIPRIHIIHNSPQLAECFDYNVAKYNKANGLTIICLEFKLNDGSIKKLFHYSVCDLEDTYSRLEGRLCAKSRLLRSLNNSVVKNVTGSFKEFSDLNLGLYFYSKNENNPVKDDSDVTARHLLNWVIKHKINKVYKKQVEDLSLHPLTYMSEDDLLSKAKQTLAEKHNLDLSTIKVSCDYVRPYHNPEVDSSFVLNQKLLCTNDFFKSLEVEGKKLLSGGYTIYLIKGVHKETGELIVFVSFSVCMPADVFNKSIGRKLCLNRFSINQYRSFKVEKGKDVDLKKSFPKVAETLLGLPVNLSLDLSPINTTK